jgi:uncharacterized protein (DUF58 family)
MGAAAAGAVLVLAGLATGAVPLFVPGLGFMLLGLGAPVVAWAAARGCRIERRLARSHVLEGQAIPGTITIRRGWFGLPGGCLCDPLVGAPVSLREPGVATSGRRARLRIIAHAHRRGRHRFPAPVLVVGDPLGLARARRVSLAEPEEILVLPRVEPVRFAAAARPRSLGPERSPIAHEPTGAGEIDGLRAYQPGASAARIHWPALARGAGLLERRLVSEPRGRPLVVLDSRCEPDAEGARRLDAAVRAAGSLILSLGRSGGCQVLLPGSRIPTALGPDLIGWGALHVRLALVEAESDPARAPLLRGETARGALVWVAAALERGELPASVAGRGAPLIMVVPRAGARPDGSVLLEVAGCVGYSVADRRTAARALAV